MQLVVQLPHSSNDPGFILTFSLALQCLHILQEQMGFLWVLRFIPTSQIHVDLLWIN